MSKAQYSIANQTDSLELSTNDGSPPDKSNRTFMQKCAFYSCLVGFGFILMGIVCAFAMSPIVKSRIRANLPLVEDTKSFNKWKDPPVNPVLYVRLFNLTNQREFLEGRAKPNLVEVGPYAYVQNISKQDVTIGPGEEAVRYTVRRFYQFSPELSNGTESDMVVMPNVPLFAGIKYMTGESSFAKMLFRQIVESFEFANDTEPFYSISVRDFLWGTPSIFVSIDRTTSLGCTERKTANEPEWDDFNDWGMWDYGENVPKKPEETEETEKKEVKSGSNPECEIRPDNMDLFGMFFGRNGTDLDPREIHTGSTNLTQKGLMISWHDMRRLNYWRDDSSCNSLEDARDPGGLPLNINKKDILKIFFGNMGRNIYFRYIQEVIVDGFRTYRFSPFEETFHNPEDNPSNLCYCMSNPCLPSGLHDISTVNENSPIILSWPHFLYGDPDLRKMVDGLHPDSSKHRFFMDVQPDYGISLAVLARLQMNVLVEKRSGFGYFDDIIEDKVYLPVMWIEEGIEGPSQEISDSVTLLLTMPDKMKYLMGFLGMIVGLLLLIPEIYFWILTCLKPNKEVDEEPTKVIEPIS